MLDGSPGPSRFANTGRPARTGVIRSNFFNEVTLFPVAAPVKGSQHHGSVPVNPGLATVYRREAPAEPRLSPVMPRWSPGESRQCPGRASVYRNYIPTSDPGRATETPRFNPGRRK
ncbi:hypothetical protein DPMN_086067 [Dreissena polymorpha]|uniref:Uncharacterized protein n=1 Tax=Dreissena polymorpha TaxID=45954 RepID=A0A9D3YDU7_DREPO|nr:hypothetical protein DPMN_086067 [Dreissena polymorpha]